MSIPIPNWATLNIYGYDSNQIDYHSTFYCVSSYFFLVTGVLFFPLSLFLCRYTVQQIVEITYGSRSGDVVGQIVGRRVYFFSTLYFVFSALFWAFTIIHGSIGIAIASTNLRTSSDIFNQYSIFFMQGMYHNNPLFLWVLFGLWAASLEFVNYLTYMLLCQKLVHLDQKNDTIPYRLIAVLIPLRFIYLFVLRGIGGVYTIYYVYVVNYFMLLFELFLFWQSGWVLAKKMTNAYELRPETDGHNMRYFCKLAVAFTAFWLVILIKYVLYFVVVAIWFRIVDLDLITFNLAYIWVSIIQAAISLIIVMVYNFKQ